jgi:hypothetical protein
MCSWRFRRREKLQVTVAFKDSLQTEYINDRLIAKEARPKKKSFMV